MSNVIVEEGYPADFHLGISMIFWFIFIVMALIISTSFILKALRTPLINRKELYIGYASTYFGLSTALILIQIGVFFPNFFLLLTSLAVMILSFSAIVLVYYWEKNLISLKKFPTIWMILLFFLNLIDLIYLVILGTHFFEFFGQMKIIFTLLTLISVAFIFVLLILFTKRVIGNLRIRGLLIIFSFIFLYIGIITDHPPVVTFYPKILSIVSPISFIIGLVMYYFGIKGICEGITSYYNQAQICTIHRGKISKGTHIYFCPNCNTNYCQKCYEQVIMKEGCWNCQEGVKTEDDDKWESEVISKIEVGKGFKKRQSK